MPVRSTPAQWRLCASRITPRPSTTPGVPTPTPSTGRSAAIAQPLREADREADRLLAGRAVEWHLGAGLDLPEEVDHRARHPVVWRQVERHDVGGVGEQADERRRLADLALDRRAELAEQAVGDEPAYQVGDGDPGEAGGPGEVGAGRGSLGEQVLEKQRTVVAPGVLGEQLANRAQRAGTHSACVHLTAPAVRPLTTRRSINANKMMTGTVATRPAANRCPQSTEYSPM